MVARTIDIPRRNNVALLEQSILTVLSGMPQGVYTRPMVTEAARMAVDAAERLGMLKHNKPRETVIQMQPAVAASDAPEA